MPAPEAPAPGPWGAASPRPRGPGPKARIGLILLAAAVLSGLVIGLLALSWEALGGTPMTVHGWIALSIAVLGTALLSAGLMALAFHSHRSGHDAQVEDGGEIYDRIRRRRGPPR